MALFAAACFLAALLSLASAQSPFPTPGNRFLSDSRRTIDFNNLTFSLISDEPQVSVGSLDAFGDGLGTTISTAVLFTTPAGNGFPIAPVRCDVLLYKTGGQARNFLTDFFLILYSDDGTEEHNPGVPLSAPLSLASYTAAMLTFRSIWYQIVVNGGNVGDWPTLNASSIYWVVLAPGDPTKLQLGESNNGYPFNGVVWAGFNNAALAMNNVTTPVNILTDPTGGNLFTAREIRSQRFASDSQFAATTAAGVNFALNTRNWGQLGSAQYRNWQATGSSVKYGLSVIGIQANPSTTPTSTGSSTSSSTSTSTFSTTSTSTSTRSSTSTGSSTATSTRTATSTSSLSSTRSSSSTSTSSSTGTSTRTSSTTSTQTSSSTRSATSSSTLTLTATHTSSSTSTRTSSATRSSSSTSSASATSSSTISAVATRTSTRSSTRSATSTGSSTSSSSGTSSSTLTASPSVTPSATPSSTSLPTTIASTRFQIDRAPDILNLTVSDATVISVGAQQPPYSDSFGTLVTTAVLFKSPANPPAYPQLLYRPLRCDLLMRTPDPQPTRAGISDFFVTLYADDGSAVHNPGVQLAAPFLMSQPAGTAPLLFYRATWYQIDISSAGWPLLSPSTYYWVAVTPSVPLQMTTQGGRLYNGAVWAALPDSLGRIPPAVVADPSLFLARQILSQRFAGDATFGANTVAAVNKNRNAEAWGEFNAAEYTNWAIVNASSGPNTTSSRARYGLQVLGFQVYPPVTVSMTPSQLPSWSVSTTPSLSSTRSMSQSFQPTQSASSSPSMTQTPYPTTITTSRDAIDQNLLPGNASDATAGYVSVGAQDPNRTVFGTLVATGVLVKSNPLPSGYPPNTGYISTRVDVLMFVRALIEQRTSIGDFFVTLYSDDGSAAHNPAQQLAAPFSLSSQTAPLQVQRGTWFEQDITAAGWPVLVPDTYYWVVVTPGSPLPIETGATDGAIWGGLSDASDVLPVQALNDSFIFKGRQLVSASGPQDSPNGASQPAAVSFLQNATQWPSVPSAETRFTNWDAVGSRVRYGVQIIGFYGPLPSPSVSSTTSVSPSRSLSSSLTPSTSLSSTPLPSPSASRTTSPTVSASTSPIVLPTTTATATATATATMSRSSTASASSSPSQSLAVASASSPTTFSPAPTITPSANPTTISETRFWIDTYNKTFDITSDRPYVSVGARNDYNDSFGNLVSTAVLIKSPANRNWDYRPTRLDLLMAMRPDQAVRSIADFYVTLFSDDNSTVHNPAQQLTAPFALTAQTAPLVTFRAIWYQQNVSGAGWPIMPAQTYYWVVVTPGTPLTMPPPNTEYNGALWSGVNEATVRPDGSPLLPPFIMNDPSLFTGRELTSERFPGDSTFGANTQAAVQYLGSSWPNAADIGAPRFTNFLVSPPDENLGPIRYGISLQGWQVPLGSLQPLSQSPSVSGTPSRSTTASLSSSVAPSLSHSPTPSLSGGLPASLSPTQSASPSPSRSPSRSASGSTTRTATASRAPSPSRSATGSASTSPSASASPSTEPPCFTDTPTMTPHPVFLASSRGWVDASIPGGAGPASDATLVSVGASDSFGDGAGSLSATAVLFQAPPAQAGQPAWAFRPARVDLLLLLPAGQARAGLADLYVALHADDGSAAHAPGAALGSPWSLANVRTPPLSSTRAAWVQVDVSGADWPLLTAQGYYWLVLLPGSTTRVISEGGTLDGLVWAGVDDSVAAAPAPLSSNPALFTARQLSSQRFYGDAAFSAGAAGALSFLQGAAPWPGVPHAPTRYTDWQAQGSRVRYGLHVQGWEVTPSPSQTPSRTASRGSSASRTPSTPASPSRTPSRSLSPSASASQSASPLAPEPTGPAPASPSPTGEPQTRSGSRSATAAGAGAPPSRSASRTQTPSPSASTPPVLADPAFVSFTVGVPITAPAASITGGVLPGLVDAVNAMLGSSGAVVVTFLQNADTNALLPYAAPGSGGGAARLLRALQAEPPPSNGWNAVMGANATAADSSPAVVAEDIQEGFSQQPPPAALQAAAEAAQRNLGLDYVPSFPLLGDPLYSASPTPSQAPSPSQSPTQTGSGTPLPASAAGAAAKESVPLSETPAVVGGSIGAVLGFLLLLAIIVIIMQALNSKHNKRDKAAEEKAAAERFLIPEHVAAVARARRISNLAAEWPAPPPAGDTVDGSVTSVGDVHAAFAGDSPSASARGDRGALPGPGLLTARSVLRMQPPGTARSVGSAWGALPAAPIAPDPTAAPDHYGGVLLNEELPVKGPRVSGGGARSARGGASARVPEALPVPHHPHHQGGAFGDGLVVPPQRPSRMYLEM